jgi:hypothetical protein
LYIHQYRKQSHQSAPAFELVKFNINDQSDR